jgi:hypothetical protein
MNPQRPLGSGLWLEWVLAGTLGIILACMARFPQEALRGATSSDGTRGLSFYLWCGAPVLLGWTLVRFLRAAVTTGSVSAKAGVCTSLAGLAVWIDLAVDRWIGG